jgi:AraC-like DNA-binding protein
MERARIPEEVASLARAHIGVIAQRSAVWDGIVSDLIVKGPAKSHEVVIEPAVDTIFLTRSNDPHRVVKQLNKGPERSVVHPGAIVNFVAAGDRLVTQVRHGNSGMDRLALSILPRALQRLDETREYRISPLRSVLMIERRLPHEILKALASEITAPGIHGRLYAETLASALVLDLIHHQGAPTRIAPIKGGLAPWQLRRVEDMINERLAEDVSLAELASATDLSKSHFARAFRKSTGLPPHKYQLNARVERAKYLLRRGDLTLAEVGLECGFCEQSHFTRAFHRIVGVSPGAWRRIQKI